MSCRYSRKRRGNKAVLSRPEGAARSIIAWKLACWLAGSGWLDGLSHGHHAHTSLRLSLPTTPAPTCSPSRSSSLPLSLSCILSSSLSLPLSLSLSPYLTLSLVAPLYEPLPSSLSPAFFGAAPARAVLCLPTDTTTTACPAPPRSLPRPSPPHGDTHSHPPHTPRQHYTRTHSDSAHSTLHP